MFRVLLPRIASRVRACVALQERSMIPKLTESLDFHSQALMLRAERQRLIASNIANADTPGYQARDFDFAQALRQATGSAPATGQGIAADVMAAPGNGPGNGRTPPTLRYATPSQTNLDNNSVDMNRERGAFAENAIRYESTLRFINGNVRTMLDAMKSHHQG
jgi:flagellar basal-body rod protein FlgB